jgi:hypothetical protein
MADKNKPTRRRILGHLIAGALGLAAGVGLKAGLDEADRIALIEKNRAENEEAILKRQRALEDAHPKDSLRDMPCEFGKIQGSQDVLWPEKYWELSVKGDHQDEKQTLKFNFLKVQETELDNAIRKALIKWHKDGAAGDGYNKYLTHDGKYEYKTYSVRLSSWKSIANVALRVDNQNPDKPAQKEQHVYLKRIGEPDWQSGNKFEYAASFKLWRTEQGVEEIVLRTLDNNEGNDTLSICRAPLVVGNPSKKIYLERFTPDKLSFMELDMKNIDLPLSVEITIPELGATMVHYVPKNASDNALFGFDLPINLQSMITNCAKQPIKCTAEITVRDQSDNGYNGPRALSRFKRELAVVPGKDGLEFVDPYDSKTNSAYNRWQKRGQPPVVFGTQKQEHWLYIFKGIKEGEEITAKIHDEPVKFKVDAINAEERAIDMTAYADFSSQTLALRPGNGKKISAATYRTKVNRISTDINVQAARIYGNEKSIRSLDFYVFDPARMPKKD